MIHEKGEASEIIMTAKKCISKDANNFFSMFVSDFWLLGIDRWGVNQIPLINHKNYELLNIKFLKFCTVCL